MSNPADRPATEPHPWENHDDSCQCHITICADCGCTNEIVPAEAAQGAAPLTIEEYNVPSMPSEYSEGAAPRAEGPRRIAGDGGPETDDWTCSCGLTRPVTGSYGCADCGDGRPDSWERVSVEGAAPRAEGLQPDTPASQFADRLAEALDKEWDAFLIEGEPSLNFGDYAERVAVRLSRRPSDERVPEEER